MCKPKERKDPPPFSEDPMPGRETKDAGVGSSLVPVVAELGAKQCAGIDLHIPVDICIGFKLDHGKKV